MRRNTYLHLIFCSVTFLSSIATAATFKELDQKLLVAYFEKNIASQGLACPLPETKVSPLFQDASIPSTLADCFVVDKTEIKNHKYLMKPTRTCTTEFLHLKLKSLADGVCDQAAKASAAAAPANGGGRGAGGGGYADGLEQGAKVLQNSARAVETAKTVQDYFKKDEPKEPQPQAQAKPTEAATVASASGHTNGKLKPAEPLAKQVAGSTQATKPESKSESGLVQSEHESDFKIDLGKGKSVRLDRSNGNFVDQDGNTVNYKSMKDSTLCTAECKAALDTLPPELRVLSKKAVDPENLANKTEVSNESKVEIRKYAGESVQQIRDLLPKDEQSAASCINVVKALLDETEKYEGDIISCKDDSSRASLVCPLSRSKTAVAVQQIMTLGSGVIATMNSASQTCGAISDLSRIGQVGMTTASLVCSGMKMMCESSCKDVLVTTENLKKKNDDLYNCWEQSVKNNKEKKVKFAPNDQQSLDTVFDRTIHKGEAGKLITSKVKQLISIHAAEFRKTKVECEKYGANVVQMMTQAAGLLLAVKQSRDCEKKLTAGDSAASTVLTVNDMCKDPANAQMLVCKCKADPGAVGCPNAIVKNKEATGIIYKTGGTGAQMAGLNNTGQPTTNSGLSPAAKTALGIDTDSKVDLNSKNNASTSGFNGADSTANSNVTGSSNSSLSNPRALKNSDAVFADHNSSSKMSFGSLSSFGESLTSMFRGPKKSNESGKFSKEQQVAAAKRQIASERFRSEVSTASGKSNWDKVRSRYSESNSSFFSK